MSQCHPGGRPPESSRDSGGPPPETPRDAVLAAGVICSVASRSLVSAPETAVCLTPADGLPLPPHIAAMANRPVAGSVR